MPLFGQYDILMDQLLNSDMYGYRNFVRLSPELFRELVERVGPRIQKDKTRFPEPLPPELKIDITLRYLATGIPTRVAYNTISVLMPEVCEAIFQCYREEQFTCPTIPHEWPENAVQFGQR